MPDPINRHYVPQFLLRNFAALGSEALHVFDKRTRRVFSTSPRNVAAERRFYDFEVESGIRLTLEPGLAELEEKASRIIQRIITSEDLGSVTLEDRALLSAFFAVQFTRTRQVRENIQHLNIQIEDWLRDQGFDPTKVEGFGPIDDEDAKLLAMKLVDDSRTEVAPHFFEKTWLLLRNPTEQPFILSDNPVALHNSQPPSLYGNLGLTSTGIEIHIPLTPQLALNLLCPSFQQQIQRGYDVLHKLQEQHPNVLDPYKEKLLRAKAFIAGASTGSPIDLEPVNVLRENSLQVRSAERWLFSHRADFSLAIEMLDKHPELAKGPRLTRS